jgi:hypothetical protein
MAVFQFSIFDLSYTLSYICQENNPNDFIHSIIKTSQLHHHIAQSMFWELIQT